MNRANYSDYILEKLDLLCLRIETKGKLNILDLHMHSENFYRDLFNLLYDYQLINLNKSLQNVPAIDLEDSINKTIIQVSAECTKKKIESALSKSTMNNYQGYTFKFISISKDASNLREKTYNNQYGLAFDPFEDIYDVPRISRDIQDLEINKLKLIYNFIKNELGAEIDPVKFESNLAGIINILSKEDLKIVPVMQAKKAFEIEKKIQHNVLKKVKRDIEKYSSYYSKLDRIYTEFDKHGSNKSLTTIGVISNQYSRLLSDDSDADSIFHSLIEKIIEKIQKSTNFEEIPIEELEFCVYILVVDAFIRCEIFENPEEESNVTS